jgi:hypothetical protein
MQCNISTRYVEALLVVAPCTTPSSAPCLPVTPFWIHQSQPLAPLFLLLLLLTPPPPSPAGGRSLEWTMEEDMGGPIRLRTLLARKVGGLCFSFILGRWVCVWGGGGGRAELGELSCCLCWSGGMCALEDAVRVGMLCFLVFFMVFLSGKAEWGGVLRL